LALTCLAKLLIDGRKRGRLPVRPPLTPCGARPLTKPGGSPEPGYSPNIRNLALSHRWEEKRESNIFREGDKGCDSTHPIPEALPVPVRAVPMISDLIPMI